MNTLAPLLDFKLDDQDMKSERIKICDYGTLRSAIRLERRQCALGVSPEALGILLAQPVSEAEVYDFMASASGAAIIMYNCVHRANNTFTQAQADLMVMEKHEFVTRILVESGLVNPPLEQTTSSPDS